MEPHVKGALRRLMPRQVRTYRILAGPLMGRKIVASMADYPGAIFGTTEPALLRWLGRNVRSGETWLDVGAHYGYTALALAQLVGSSGRVFAFEPMLSTAASLSETRRQNLIDHMMVVPIGLSYQPQLTHLVVPTTRGMADATLATSPAETIFVIALDNLWQNISRGNPIVHGIKLDVQGMELDAVRGMAETLRTYKPVLIIEFHRGVNRDHLLDLLEELGYERQARPIEPKTGRNPEVTLLDDTSYAFQAAGAASEIR